MKIIMTNGKDGKIEILSKIETIPKDVVEDLLNEVSKVNFNELVSKVNNDIITKANSCRNWQIVAIIEMIVIIIIAIFKLGV